MSKVRFRLNTAGIEAVLSSDQMQDLLDQMAGRIAAEVSASRPDVEVAAEEYDFVPSPTAKGRRAASQVVIRDVRGKVLQARDGILTRSAAAAGLEVTEKP